MSAKQQAIAQYESIAAMVAALNGDYDRLEKLREAEEDARCMGEDMDPDTAKELRELEEEAGDYKDADEARERIQEDALDVQVNYGWHAPGNFLGDVKPEEFMILLCTGGPAVRIMGELDEYSQPCRAWIEYQDWGTSWTMLYETDERAGSEHINTLLAYCQQFYFGE